MGAGGSLTGAVRGAVAAGSAATAGAAAEVLRGGGNAFDAVVAAGFAATVAEPILASAGGGGFCLVRTAAGEEVVVDGFVAMPGLGGPPHDPAELASVRIEFGTATQVFHVGPASVAVPGFVPLLAHVAARFGRWGLDDLVAPAVRLAADGVEVDATFERVLGLVWPIVSRTAEGRARFGRDGTTAGGPLRRGERFVPEGLGAFLLEVGAGTRPGLAAGELGPGVTAADVAAYEVVERVPLRVGFGDAVVVTNPPPSFGGSLVAHGLESLRCGGGGAAATAVADALRAMAERRGGLGPGVSRGTTHVSVADADGNVAALTVSNGSGSGEMVPGTGVQLNNMLGEEDLHPGGLGSLAPGERIGSMMAPMVVELAGGGLVAAGSGGSERIRSALLQLVVGVVARGSSLADAVMAPRCHWDEATLQVEGGLPADVLAELRAWGPVNQWPGRDFFFGGVHAVERSAGGMWSAIGDARRGGLGLVVD